MGCRNRHPPSRRCCLHIGKSLGIWAFRNSLTRRQKRHARRSDAGHTALAPRSRRPPGVTRARPDVLADQGVDGREAATTPCGVSGGQYGAGVLASYGEPRRGTPWPRNSVELGARRARRRTCRRLRHRAQHTLPEHPKTGPATTGHLHRLPVRDLTGPRRRAMPPQPCRQVGTRLSA